MAYRAFSLINDINQKNLLAMGISTVFFLLMAFIGIQDNKTVINAAAFCAIYLAILTVFTVIKKQQNVKTGKLQVLLFSILFVLIITELSISTWLGVKTVGTKNRNEYLSKYDDIKKLLGLQKKTTGLQDKADFFRTEFASQFTFNDSQLFGFNGISFFSSTINNNISNYLYGLGLSYNNKANFSYFAETSPLTNAFLNLRYLISNAEMPRRDRINFWNTIANTDPLTLHENRYYLPLGFIVNNELKNYAHTKENPFHSQNELFRLATGLQGDLFSFIDISRNYNTVQGYLGESFLKWDYKMSVDAMLFVYCQIEGTELLGIIQDDTLIQKEIIRFRHLFPVRVFLKDTNISFVSEALKNNAKPRLIFHVGYMDKQLFEQGYALLAAETLQLTKFTEKTVTGTITTSKGGLLYTSIPYSKYWRAYRNGIKSEIVLIDGCMMALPLSAGNHNIEFKYYNYDLTIGFIISLVSLVMFVMMLLLDRHRKL